VLQYDFEESIGYWLTMAHQAYHREFTARVAPHGITYRQAQVLVWLVWLVVDGRLTQAELATLRRLLSRVQANMSRTIAAAKCD
jgi:MarR family transcriptional regulator for hemolysin